ncbi:hypothetical protein AB0C38_31950 [Amycolatopsis sp. NPDC048633]|uniref:hypothetical protein n=1 Tax=Amycolatopsis sp. NPDC048633 TaxID=3157095 RepID=UPI0033E3CA60
MTRPLALVGVLLALVTLLATVAPKVSATPATWTPVRDIDGATGARCELDTSIRTALERLHEPGLRYTVESGMDAGGYAEPEHIVISDAWSGWCSLVWAVVAHEVAHVRQFRDARPLSDYEAEIGADCAALRTGWLTEQQSPYLAERHAHGGPAGCTDFEQLTAWLLASDWGQR